MVYQKLCIYAEEPVQQLFIVIVALPSYGASCHIPHGIQSVGSQPLCRASTHSPEVGDGYMVPEQLSVASLIYLRYPDSVLVRVHMLRHYIHGDLRQVHVGAYPRRCGDPGLLLYLSYHLYGQFMGCHIIDMQIRCHVDEDLIHGISEDILRCHIAQIYAVYPGTVLHIQRHPGLRCHKVKAFLSGHLHHLKESGPSRYSQCLQSRGHCEADSLFRPALVRHHEAGSQRIQSTLPALYGCVERLQVYGNICPAALCHAQLPDLTFFHILL